MATVSRGGYENIFDGVKVLTSKQGDIAVSDLNGKIVGIYFSAHWCGPCRQFTPTLATKYTEIKKEHPDFEIVFLSSDQDKHAFAEYYKNSMPWIALPYEARDLKDRLSKKFKVSGIPALIILDQNGEIINENGRSGIMSRPFPFYPPTFEECLGELFMNSNGDQFDWSHLRGKTLGLYVSAAKYPVARSFTTDLVTTYNAMRQRNIDFEVIYIGADKNQEQFQDHINEMPWLHIPWEQLANLKQPIFRLAGIQAIPALYICQSDGTPIQKHAVNRVKKDPEGIEFPWIPLPIQDINDVVDQINDFPTLILFQHSLSPVEQTENKQKFFSIAEQQLQLGEDRQILICTANETGDMAERIRALSGMKEETRAMILDIPDRGGFYTYPIPQDAAEASILIQQYLDKNSRTERQQLSNV